MKDGVFNLRRLALVGGGRWARVLISVLHEILPPDARILVVTLGNGAAMRKWSTERYPDRIEVRDFLPDARGEFDAVIVANAARGHAEAALRAHLSEILRETYAGITAGYHLNKRHWNSIAFDADVPLEETLRLVGHSYDRVVDGLTRKEKAALAAILETPS